MKVTIALLLSALLLDVAASFVSSSFIRRTVLSPNTIVKGYDGPDIWIELVRSFGGAAVPGIIGIYIINQVKDTTLTTIKAEKEISAAAVKAEKEISAAAVKAEKDISAKTEAAIFAAALHNNIGFPGDGPRIFPLLADATFNVPYFLSEIATSSKKFIKLFMTLLKFIVTIKLF